MTDADVARAMDEMKTHSGATVVRTWFMQAYGGPGNWSQFDRVLSAASARGIKIIPVLVDQGASCEPWPIGVPHYRTLAWYQSGYTRPDYGYALSYRDYAAAIAKHYAGNTTIAFWQLVNEAEALTSAGGSCDEQAANHALRSFADDVAGLVKANDPSHLVSLGTIGGGQCGAAGSADYRYLHAGLIDLCEYHEYWGKGAVPGDQWNGVATRINDCHALNKPIFAGEVGIDASIQPDGTTSAIVTKASLALRAQYLQSKMKAQFPMGLVGFLVWDYDNGPSKYYEVGPGDPTEAVMAQVAATLPGAGP
jgi:mannan endo-1,4-beta-mannosidase